MLNDVSQILLSSKVNVVMTGCKLLLRPISQCELTAQYLAWLNDAEINKYMAVRWVKQTLETVVKYINCLRSKSGCELFGIFLKSNGDHIGGVSLNEYDVHNGIVSCGWMIGDASNHRRGYGVEAVILCLNYIFSDSRIRRVYVTVIADNIKSRHTIEKVGFQREGILRQHNKLASDEICDFYYYGMLKEEWQVNREKFRDILEVAHYEKY
ncbi:MAG: GNAT family protein [Pseudomonadota bacterium]